MQFRKSPFSQHSFHSVRRRAERPAGSDWRRLPALLCLACTVAAMVATAQSNPLQTTPPSILLPSANLPLDANGQMRMLAQSEQDKKINAANAERKKQLAEDSARLFQMATELKTEVDKTNKDMLSLTVIRKAEEVERLARGLRVKMSTGGR